VDFCFDTSEINQLHDDVCRNEIVAGLFAENRVPPTVWRNYSDPYHHSPTCGHRNVRL
jgi:hypothetical protein